MERVNGWWPLVRTDPTPQRTVAGEFTTRQAILPWGIDCQLRLLAVTKARPAAAVNCSRLWGSRAHHLPEFSYTGGAQPRELSTPEGYRGRVSIGPGPPFSGVYSLTTHFECY